MTDSVLALSQINNALIAIDGLIRLAVLRAEAAGHDPTDTLRGLTINSAEVERLLARQPMTSFLTPEVEFSLPPLELTNDSPLYLLAERFQLTPLDVFVLLLSVAPDIDQRYERLYGYLQDDVTLRHMTVNLAMNILGSTPEQRMLVWERLALAQPLRQHNLLQCITDQSRANSSMLADLLVVDQRIAAFLLADSAFDARLDGAVRMLTPVTESDAIDVQLNALCDAMATSPILFIDGHAGCGQAEIATILAASIELSTFEIDATKLIKLEVGIESAWHLALREARLLHCALFIAEWEILLDEHGEISATVWSALQAHPLPVIISSQHVWEPPSRSTARRFLRLHLELPSPSIRLRHWHRSVASLGVEISASILELLATRFRFTNDKIQHVVETSFDLAASEGRAVSEADLYEAAYRHSSLRLGRFAKLIKPRYHWQDLILPEDRLEQLHELVTRIAYADQVNNSWGFGEKIAPNQGISALFAGESGTGKTMSAEVIANELGLVLYQIDLSAVVSKYIGETEKNLNVIFTEAQFSNAILFFDEADALFGKRSEVQDAHDRYANIETAYLLQQIDDYDGVALLATNLRQNLDDAFTRRLDFLIDFPFPEVEFRHGLWLAHFPKHAPLAADVDLLTVAERYRLSGGSIRNAALAAAYLAASDNSIITQNHIKRAIRREYQKMGQLVDISLGTRS